MGRQPEEGQGGNPNGADIDLEYLKFAEFRKTNPPSFQGTFNPDKGYGEDLFQYWHVPSTRRWHLLSTCWRRTCNFGGLVRGGCSRVPRLTLPRKCLRMHFIRSISPLLLESQSVGVYATLVRRHERIRVHH